ncbi:MAG: sigma-70 family RNA polymerase sigma factor [Smithella sp.]|jgi:RNA polymerase sigma-70 factor (ECF subfamily)
MTNRKETATDDEDLKYVILCQKGDPDAFGVLVERHQKKMLNIAFRMTGDYDEACDITQEAFVAAYKSIKKFKAEAKFSTWLYRIVVNYSKNRLKQLRGKNRREGVFLDDSGGIKTEEILNQSLINDANPGTQMERRERETQVQKCITSLGEEYREVLVLRDIQGLSYDEISDMLKIPDGTVKSRLSRARNALKDGLIKVIGDL